MAAVTIDVEQANLRPRSWWRAGTKAFAGLILALGVALIASGAAQAVTSANPSNPAAATAGAVTKGQAPTLVVGSEQEFPPFATGMTDADAGGFTVDLWKAVATEVGLRYTIRVRPFYQLLQEFKDGQIDVLINLAQSDERRQFADFTVTHVTVNGAIFVRKGQVDIHSKDDLASKSIIVINADLAHDYARSKGWGKQLVLVETAADGLRLLAAGQHDAMLLSKLTGLQTLRELGLTNVAALTVKPGFSQKFAFATQYGQADLLAKLNEGLAVTKANGVYNALYQKWFGLYEEKEVGLRDVLKYVVPVVALLLAWVGYLFYRRQKERTQAQAAVTASRDLLKTIIDTAPVRVFWKDRNLHYLGCNAAFALDAGMTHPDELIGKDDYQMGWAAQAGLYRADDLAVMTSATAKLAYEEPQTTPGGQTIWLRTSKVPLRNQANETIGLLGVYEDITERKKAEEAVRDAAAYTRSLIEASLDPLVVIDALGKMTDVNSAAEQLTGMARGDLIGIDVATAVTDPEKAHAGLQQVFAQGIVKDYELAVRHVSGRITDILLNGSVYRDGKGNVLGVLVTARDITARLQTEEKLRQLSTAVEQSPASVVITDLDAIIQYVNPRFTEVTGYSAAEVIGQNARILQSKLTPQDTFRELWGKLTSGMPWHGELINRRKNGEIYWEDSQIAPVKNPAGTVTHYVAVKTDITERKQLEEQVQQMAFHDVLTKLPNRRLLIDRLTQTMVISKRSGRFGALMFLDLDNFKPLNDTHGHGVGDSLLVEVARRLTACVREIDTVARTGGDEFVVLLGHLDTDEATSAARAGAIAEKILIKLAEPYVLPVTQEGRPAGMVEHHCTASIGVIIFIDHQFSQEDILKWADSAMYKAKDAGRNLVRFHDPKA